MIIAKVLFCCYLLVLPISLQGRSCSNPMAFDSVKKFVQGFYDWYVPLALSSSSEPASDRALKIKRKCFITELGRKLREDSDAQAKVEGEIVGLDFDPFLSGQDPGRHYIVGKVLLKGEIYLVEVHRVVSGKPEDKATVTAEVTGKNGQWYFVNFIYPDGHDLLGVLKALKVDRDKPNY